MQSGMLSPTHSKESGICSDPSSISQGTVEHAPLPLGPPANMRQLAAMPVCKLPAKVDLRQDSARLWFLRHPPGATTTFMFRLQTKNHAPAMVVFWSSIQGQSKVAALHLPFCSKKPVAGVSIKTGFELLRISATLCRLIQGGSK